MAEAKKAKTVKKPKEETIIEEKSDLKSENTETQEAEKPEAKKSVAKAGKRSKKAVEAEEEKAAKEERKAEAKEVEAPKPAPKKQKPRVKRYSKNQKAARELLEAGKHYSLDETVELLPKISKVKFDATVEVHIRLGIDPRQADQQFRSNVVLPAGSGKKVRVAVLADEKKSEAAKKAGADLVGADSILAAIAKSKFDFDVLVATPDQMAALGKHAKVLGPKGLMPSPKSGTVSADPAAAVEQIKAGRLELKNDAGGIIHAGVGKLSFKPDKLRSNLAAAITTVASNKPSGVKGTFIKSISVSTTMSPGINLDVNSAIADSKK